MDAILINDYTRHLKSDDNDVKTESFQLALKLLVDCTISDQYYYILANEGQVFYTYLLDNKVKSLLLKNPPATQNAPSEPDGTGMAIEILNCPRITDLFQVTGLMYPRELAAIGDWSATYDWTKYVYNKLGKSGNLKIISGLMTGRKIK
tara:strand:- start:270 stop:716 length:447 start_codon:yes stop_codon:yes gene_type:complete